MSAGWTSLRQELDRLAGRAGRGLRRARAAAALRRAVRRRLALPLLTMAAYAALQLIARLAASEALRPSTALWVGWAAGLYAAALALDTWSAGRATVGRGRALGEWDRQLALHDRLGAADEFLGREERSPFMEAAVADAAEQLERARAAELRFEREAAARRPWPALPALLLLLLAGVWLGGWQAAPVFEEPGVHAGLPRGAPAREVAAEADAPPHEAEAAAPSAAPKPSPPDREATAETHASAAGEEDESKETEGRTGSGRSSAAEPSTGAGSAQGSPSQQGQISKPGEKKTSAARKRAKPKEPPRADDRPKKNEEQESGSTAGRGSSRGSNRNPAASDWASKDHVNTPDDEDLEQEDEVDEEEEDQEARGGMQPSLRDRKPPVSRDLTIGFGNQPNPDANGRGGPSQPKKSRGTASLVLGVPIPDRVKGQPNPGKTKITQERVQPRAEPAVPVDAAARTPRQDPSAALRRQELLPWMRGLVRDYFRNLRRTSNESS